MVIACVALVMATSAPAGTAELRDQTLRAYSEYIESVRRWFDEHASSGNALADISPTDMTRSVRDGHILVEAGRECCEQDPCINEKGKADARISGAGLAA
jgi:hypothetical protein